MAVERGRAAARRRSSPRSLAQRRVAVGFAHGHQAARTRCWRTWPQASSCPPAAKDNSLTLPTRGARGTHHRLGLQQRERRRRRRHRDAPECRRRRPGRDAHRDAGAGGSDDHAQLHGRGAAAPAIQSRAQFDFENSLVESLGRFPAGSATGDRVWNAGMVGFDAGHEGQALRLNGTNGVRLPTGLISNYEYTVSFWINPTVITRFTTGFFGAVNERWMARASRSPRSGCRSCRRAGTATPCCGAAATSGSTAAPACASRRIMAPPRVQREPAAWCPCTSMACGASTAARCTDFFSTRTGIFALGVNYWDLPFNGMIDELKVYEAALSARGDPRARHRSPAGGGPAGFRRDAARPGRHQRRTRGSAPAAQRRLCHGDHLAVLEPRGAQQSRPGDAPRSHRAGRQT